MIKSWMGVCGGGGEKRGKRTKTIVRRGGWGGSLGVEVTNVVMSERERERDAVVPLTHTLINILLQGHLRHPPTPSPPPPSRDDP